MKSRVLPLVLVFLVGCTSGALKQVPFVRIDTPQALYVLQPYGSTVSQPVQRTVTGSFRIDKVDTVGETLSAKREWHIDTTVSIFYMDTVRDAKGKALPDSLGHYHTTRLLSPLPLKYVQFLNIVNH